ncbi:MAG: cupredoxin domain-containing protein [Candidatus Dormibacteria bacterium]
MKLQMLAGMAALACLSIPGATASASTGGVVVSFHYVNQSPATGGLGTGSVVATRACSDGSTPEGGTAPDGANEAGVAIPAISTFSVNQGDQLGFTNHDPAPHTVTADCVDPSSGLPLFDTGDFTGSVTLDTSAVPTGTWTFHCNVHPFMFGILKVN